MSRLVERVVHRAIDPDETSVELLREFERTGRADVFETFMRRHASMVYATCLKVTRDPHDAEDATQATFLTLASKSRLNGDIRQPEAWLRKVAHRLSLDLIRSKKRRINRENVRSTMNDEVAPLDSHDHADNGEVRGILNEELAKLPASYRMPLILHYFGGLSREEMADQLKLKPSTLGVRLHRAREQLRKRLAGRGIALPAVALTALLSEAVQQSIAGSLARGTAHHASAIALGHVAPPMFAMSATPVGLGSIRSLLSVLAQGKFKLSLIALVLSSAISMTSAQVRSFTSDVLRSILPSLTMPSVPTIELRVSMPKLVAATDSPNAPSDLAIAMPAVWQRPFNVPAALPMANRFNALDASHGTAAATPAVPMIASRGSNAVPLERGGLARFDAGVAERRTAPPLSPRAVNRATASSPRTASDSVAAAGRNANENDRGESTVAAARTPSMSFATGVGGILPTRDFPIGVAAPDALASRGDDADATPAKAGASITGRVPGLPRPPTDDAPSPRETVVAVSGGSSSGGSAAGGGVGPRGHTNSIARPPATPPRAATPIASIEAPRDVPHTAVFTGTSANYGGYADADWTPRQLTDLTNVIPSADASPVSQAFEASLPTIPGTDLSINGARVTVHGSTSAVEPVISFIDTTATQVPTLPSIHTFIGIWALDAHETFSSADLLVRYDDLRAARLGLDEQVLKLWVSDGASWTLLWKDPTFGRDADQNLLWVTAQGDFKYFAVSSPEPAAMALTLSVVGVLAGRRRR